MTGEVRPWLTTFSKDVCSWTFEGVHKHLGCAGIVYISRIPPHMVRTWQAAQLAPANRVGVV
jgi:hypothetical protein